MEIVITEVRRLVSLGNRGVTLRLQYKHYYYNGWLLHLMDEDWSFVSVITGDELSHLIKTLQAPSLPSSLPTSLNINLACSAWDYEKSYLPARCERNQIRSLHPENNTSNILTEISNLTCKSETSLGTRDRERDLQMEDSITNQPVFTLWISLDVIWCHM